MKVIVIVLGVLMLSLVGCVSGENFKVDESLLQEGDFAFRGGISPESRVVEVADRNGIYSHSGIVVKEDGKFFIIHAVPGEENETGGVQVLKKDSVGLFFASDRACCGCFARYDTCLEVRQKAAEEAKRWFNKKVLFDNDYLLSDTSQLYCTQLVSLCYSSQGIDLTEGRNHFFPLAKERILYPSDILQNEKVDRFYILKPVDE
ncbi:MAG: hypothetical protein HUK15_06175 [Bacteroidales bacterium]|nr:hypothetical protein [Bacteroidales bacterium]